MTPGLGIAILASEFAWPRRLLRAAASRLPAGLRGLAPRSPGGRMPR
ncbi:MAG TPA: hypothetical protein VJX71_06455 [Methylomirabilota bacterium]|nr:hypothetical protein [Methylomirabilota bacterium]